MVGIGAALFAAGCGSSSTQSVASEPALSAGGSEIGTVSDSADADRDEVGLDATRCIVRLHGKGGSGDATSVDDQGVRSVMPTGNAEAWGGRQWLYFPDDRYDEARDVVSRALEAEGCGVAVVNGFSNGAAFAASLLCAGETFGDIVQGYVIDDPVTDTATADCAPPVDVERALYWTSAIDQPVGTDCGQIDWTCAGGTTVDIETYAAGLETEVIESPNTDHAWYRDAPEIIAFLES